jgi:hypothetical protein
MRKVEALEKPGKYKIALETLKKTWSSLLKNTTDIENLFIFGLAMADRMVVVDGRVEDAIGVANQLLAKAASDLEESIMRQPCPCFIVARKLVSYLVAADRIDEAFNIMKRVHHQLSAQHYIYRT